MKKEIKNDTDKVVGYEIYHNDKLVGVELLPGHEATIYLENIKSSSFIPYKIFNLGTEETEQQ